MRSIHQKLIGFSTEGKLSSYEKIASQISDNSCIVIGGFQKGHFSDSVENKITESIFCWK